MALRPGMMRGVIKEVSKHRKNGLGGFVDAASIVVNPSTLDGAVRFTFTAMIMNTFPAGNTSANHRAGIVARARVSPGRSVPSHVQLFLAASYEESIESSL